MILLPKKGKGGESIREKKVKKRGGRREGEPTPGTVEGREREIEPLNDTERERERKGKKKERGKRGSEEEEIGKAK